MEMDICMVLVQSQMNRKEHPMPLKIALCDDEPNQILQMKTRLHEWSMHKSNDLVDIVSTRPFFCFEGLISRHFPLTGT